LLEKLQQVNLCLMLYQLKLLRFLIPLSLRLCFSFKEQVT
jgi:hypothetical protein